MANVEFIGRAVSRLVARLAENPAITFHVAFSLSPSEGNYPRMPSLYNPCCGCRMIIFETFERGTVPRYPPTARAAKVRIDTSSRQSHCRRA